MINCRTCNTSIAAPFVSLGNSPVSNAYLTEEQRHRVEPYYPLDAYVCPVCWLVQIEEFEKAERIFSADYAYFSSYSDSWLTHCQQYVDMMMERYRFGPAALVVEVASNDGYLLQYFKHHNVPVLGIEPTANTAAIAIAKGIATDVTFFNTAYAQALAARGRAADLIIGNNVLAHNPDLNDFVEGLRIGIKPQGIITLEFPHLLQLISNNQFDTIYQEHFSYFSLHAVEYLFHLHGLTVFNVEEIPTHGGSLRVYARNHEDQSHPITARVQEVRNKELQAGLLQTATYQQFQQRVHETKRNLLRFLIQAKSGGKRVAAYGAPAKGNTLLCYCGIRTDFIDYTVDRNPHKQNKFLPGSHIPVKAPDFVREDKPDYLLILPWNIKGEIMEQMAYIRGWGGKFVVPIPALEVI